MLHGHARMDHFKYTAFITYSHDDVKEAAWLQKALESYRLPKEFVASEGYASRRLGKFFRDRSELPAGNDLALSIRSAIQNSRFLIVVCSPAAVKSQWVNKEIQEFRRCHGDKNILCMIVGGEPFAATVTGDEADECFPPGLGYQDQQDLRVEGTPEPIAADIRHGANGRRLATIKLAAGLLGVGLDSLLKRDAQRRYRRMVRISIASAAGMMIMAVLSIVAIDARNDEQMRRAEAEDLVEFMLGDLRDRLDAVGRLDVLDSVGEKAIEYYSRVDLDEHSDDALGRRARAFHLLGEVEDLRGDMKAARSAFEEAHDSTEELVRRSQGDGNLIFDHAQSVFWVGYLNWRLGSFVEAEAAFLEYLSLANRLNELDSANTEWVAEAGHANLNLGTYSLDTGAPSSAVEYFRTGLAIFQNVSRRDPGNLNWQSQVAQAHAWLADAYQADGALASASNQRAAEQQIYVQLLSTDPQNRDVQLSLVNSYRARSEILLQLGDVPAAVGDLVDAKSIGDRLYELEPSNGLVAQILAGIYANLGEATSFADTRSGVEVLFAEASRIAARLVSLDGSVLKWAILQHRVALQRLRVQVQNSEFNDENLLIDLMGRAGDLKLLAAERPQVREIVHLLAECHYLIASIHSRASPSAESVVHWQMTIEALSPLEPSLPPKSRATLASAYQESGDAESARILSAQLTSIEFRHPGFLIRK